VPPPVSRSCPRGGQWRQASRDELLAKTNLGAIVDAPGELAAGGVNVIPARATHGGEHAATDELVPEALDGFGRGAAVLRARKRIEWNQVQLRRMPLQQLHELARLGDGVVHAIQHHVLERDAAAVLFVDVVPAGFEQLRDRVHAVDRHELVAQLVIRRVQGDGERDVHLLRKLVHLRDEARR
jgi:hypothetical protein